jgi:hypothetical protein
LQGHAPGWGVPLTGVGPFDDGVTTWPSYALEKRTDNGAVCSERPKFR